MPRCYGAILNSFHDQQRLIGRMNQVFRDVNLRNPRINQRPGRWSQLVKVWFDCGIKRRDQVIKTYVDQLLINVNIIAVCSCIPDREQRNDKHQPANRLHAPILSESLCRKQFKSGGRTAARALAMAACHREFWQGDLAT